MFGFIIIQQIKRIIMSTCFIPQKMNVGFQKRTDTFTGQLAYIIYYDEKGVLRKESSWQSWRDKSIPNIEIDNKPISGFVINKGVQRSADWFGTGRTMVRIHDPRGFEFEITVSNFMEILMHSDVSKREILQECVYAWFGTSLVLLPTNSIEYQESLKFTENRTSTTVKAKDLVKGATYGSKKSLDDFYVYLGYHEWFDWDYVWNSTSHGVDAHCVYTRKNKGKKHIFYDLTYKNITHLPPANLVAAKTNDIHEQYSEMVEQFFNETHSSPGVNIIPVEENKIVHIQRYHTDYYYVMACKELQDNKWLVIRLQGEKIESSDGDSSVPLVKIRKNQWYNSTKLFSDSKYVEIGKDEKQNVTLKQSDGEFNPEISRLRTLAESLQLIDSQRPHEVFYRLEELLNLLTIQGYIKVEIKSDTNVNIPVDPFKLNRY